MIDLEIPFDKNEAYIIDAVEDGSPMPYKKLNQLIHEGLDKGYKRIILNNVCGQRFLGAALEGDIQIFINGVAGNDLGIFMDGPEIFVNGNAEDQAGNTMNSGKIIVNGSTGDVTGLSARGGEIYVKNDTGYRIGIHIKEYKGKMPKVVIGGICKDYFGEYMSGGLLLVLGLDIKDFQVMETKSEVFGNCIGSGIHGGVIYVRTNEVPEHLLGIGAKVVKFTEEDKHRIEPLIQNFCRYFKVPEDLIWSKPFKKITAASKRPFAAVYAKDLI